MAIFLTGLRSTAARQKPRSEERGGFNLVVFEGEDKKLTASQKVQFRRQSNPPAADQIQGAQILRNEG